jgi:hypothetical protein
MHVSEFFWRVMMHHFYLLLVYVLECTCIDAVVHVVESISGEHSSPFVEKKYMSPWNGFQPSREATSLTTI